MFTRGLHLPLQYGSNRGGPEWDRVGSVGFLAQWVSGPDSLQGMCHGRQTVLVSSVLKEVVEHQKRGR